MGETGGTMAAAYKAAGFQIIAGQLGNGIRFPCKQRLIYSNLPQKDNGIRTDLASVFEFHDIIPHKLGGWDFLPRTVPDTGNLLFRKKGEPVDCLLGTDFLKNADKRIGGGYDKEKQVGIRPHRDQADGQYDKYQVEEGKGIGFYNLSDCFGRGGIAYVSITIFQTRLHLIGGQADGRIDFPGRDFRQG